jgi:microcystin-dependent protein
VALYPPTYQQEGSYPAQYDRLFVQDVTRNTSLLLSGTGAYLVSQRAAGTDMSVDIQPGRIAVLGTDAPNQGTYICWSDTVANVKVLAAPGAGQSRIDVVVAAVRDDNVIGGGNNDFQLLVIEGTPANTGSQAAPVLPHSSVALAQILLGPNATPVTNAMITDVRPPVLAFPQPAGALQAWLGDATQPPPGWTVADGRALSRTGVGANLFGMWGTRFGTGDGSTTFNVPNLAGLLPVFAGGAIGLPMGSVGGAQYATLGSGHIPQLSAGVAFSDPTHYHPISGYEFVIGTASAGPYYLTDSGRGTTAVTFTPNSSRSSTGLSGSVTIGNPNPAAFQIVPPVIGVVPLIKL